MSASREIRDSGRNRLSTINAELSDLTGAVFDGAGIEVELTYGKCRAVRLKPGVAAVMVQGEGGGYCWDRQWSKKRLAAFLDATTPDDPLVRRAAPAEVWSR